MIFNFNNIFESFNQEAITAEMQIQVGDAVIKKENISAPGFILEQQYIQTLKRIISEKPKPMSVKFTVGKDIFDDAIVEIYLQNATPQEAFQELQDYYEKNVW